MATKMRATPQQVAAAAVPVFKDFRKFCALLKIKTKAGGKIRFDYSTWNAEQKQFQKRRTGRDIALKPRQIGFSTIELARDLWYALTHEGVNVLVMGHEKHLVEQLFLTIKLMAEALDEIGLLPETRYDNVRELVFAKTGSAIRVEQAGETPRAAAKKGRSGTVHRFHATEVAFWGEAATTLGGVMSSIPDTGEYIFESTANGVGGVFYEEVMAAANGTGDKKLHFFPWYEHAEYTAPLAQNFNPAPRDEWERRLRTLGVTDGQIQWWRNKVDSPSTGLEKALQEYPFSVETAFRSNADAYIDAPSLDAIADHVHEPIELVKIRHEGVLLGELRVYTPPRADRQYVIGGDVSEGIGKDASAWVVLDKRTAEHCATFWSVDLGPGDHGRAGVQIGMLYNMALLAPERQNHGHATLEAIEKEKYPHVFVAEDDKAGWLTSSVTRPVMFDDLRTDIRAGVACTPDAQLHGEAKTLVRNDKGKPEAKGKGKPPPEGCRDDIFIAWAIARQVRQYVPKEIQTIPQGAIPNL